MQKRPDPAKLLEWYREDKAVRLMWLSLPDNDLSELTCQLIQDLVDGTYGDVPDAEMIDDVAGSVSGKLGQFWVPDFQGFELTPEVREDVAIIVAKFLIIQAQWYNRHREGEE